MKPFSIIIPVYNEQDVIVQNTEALMAHLVRRHKTFEIIIGSNGSVDKTVALGKGLAERYPPVRFFHLPQRGVGYAFREAARMARYDFIVSLDMDLSIDLDFIEHAVGLLDGGYGIVVGSKKMGQQKRSAVRKLGSGLFILSARFLLGLAFEDYSIAAKGYRKSVLLRYLDRVDHGTSYVIDIICLAHRNGTRIIEIPVRCEDLRASKFNIVHEGVYRFANLFKLWLGLTHINSKTLNNRRTR
ncbi:MAG: glycosyltransferase [Desulfobacterales bacterium]|nr:glycosyltransferase [Desulfobacterales bacterium]